MGLIYLYLGSIYVKQLLDHTVQLMIVVLSLVHMSYQIAFRYKIAVSCSIYYQFT